GNHLTFLLLIPAVLAVFIWAQQNAHRMRSLLGDAQHTPVRTYRIWMAPACVAGLSVYFYLPLAANRGAASHWSTLDSLSAVWLHLSGDLYRGYLFAVPVGEVVNRLLAAAALVLSDFQWLGVGLALIGFVAQVKRHSLAPLLVLCAAIPFLAFAVGYNTSDWFVYLLPLWLCFACGVAWGIEFLATYSRPRLIVPLALACWLALLVVSRWTALDVSMDRVVEQFARRTLGDLPRDSVLLTRSDQHTFALWYFTEVRHVRDDIVVVDEDLLAVSSAREALRRRAPRLLIPADGLVASFVAANRAHRAIFALDAATAAVTSADDEGSN
ncbi:MAG: hypothetical protein LC737_09595, partial [Chloroflexi bacterium]|nr:hypothetical protein [Chloroflexota bacterium]